MDNFEPVVMIDRGGQVVLPVGDGHVTVNAQLHQSSVGVTFGGTLEDMVYVGAISHAMHTSILNEPKRLSFIDEFGDRYFVHRQKASPQLVKVSRDINDVKRASALPGTEYSLPGGLSYEAVKVFRCRADSKKSKPVRKKLRPRLRLIWCNPVLQ